MIVTLTPNPAVDLTYRLPVLTAGRSHRVGAPQRRAGGKGVNTAGVLARMGVEHRCAAAVGAEVAPWWEQDLRARGVQPLTVTVHAPHRTRSTTAYVTDDGEATLLSEEGECCPAQAWSELTERVLDALSGSGAGQRDPSSRSVLAVCGSLAPDTPLDPLLGLVSRALEQGVAVVVDGSGPWLRAVLPLRPTLVRPNASEAHGVTGETDAAASARRLVELGARAAVVSSGEEGAVLQTPAGAWRARPGARLNGNPTGAGDAATAAIVTHLAQGDPAAEPDRWPELLVAAVAWSGAAVLSPLAGDVDPADVRRLTAEVGVQRLAGDDIPEQHEHDDEETP